MVYIPAAAKKEVDLAVAAKDEIVRSERSGQAVAAGFLIEAPQMITARNFM
ncbi:hypothetical protein D3C80_1885660 [compost metagenome]